MSWFDDLGDIATGVATGGIVPAYSALNDATGNTLNNLTGIGTSSAGKQARENAQTLEALGAAPDVTTQTSERYKSVGDPRDYLSQLADTNYNNINVDPSFRDAQKSALSKLSDITSGNGLSQADLQQIDQIGREEALRAKGQRDSLTQNAQSRGVAGSGLEMASLLGNEQASADRAATRGTDVAQMAQQRALQAVGQQANLGIAGQGQLYGEASDKAHAQDLINQFNTLAQNQAGQAAFSNQQDIANKNTSVANQDMDVNRNIAMDNYNNQLNYINNIAAAKNKVAADKMSQSSLLGNRITQAASAVAPFLGPAAAGTSAVAAGANQATNAVNTANAMDSINNNRLSYTPRPLGF
jgi:hypothetical protein